MHALKEFFSSHLSVERADREFSQKFALGAMYAISITLYGHFISRLCLLIHSRISLNLIRSVANGVRRVGIVVGGLDDSDVYHEKHNLFAIEVAGCICQTGTATTYSV